MLAYLFSRFPVVSQTFCDTEMLALEGAGHRLVIGSLNPPPNSFRHERLARLQAEIIYPPPAAVLDAPLTHPSDDPVWLAMASLAAAHETNYGPSFKPHVRARNAWHFAREFKRRGVRHLHIHFANRATHTALFLKKAGFTYSFTAHAQDFMVDLGNDDLLREMIREATFTAAVSDFSRSLLAALCPDAADRIHRVYNGIDPAHFPKADPGWTKLPPGSRIPGSPASTIDPGTSPPPPALRILSVGRLIDFKGFPVLIDAMALLRDQHVPADLRIIGEGPRRSHLEAQIDRLGLQDRVRLCGVLSQEEIKKELAASDVFALACLTDSKGATDILPTVILEAMACALPVVSTTLAGVPEMVRHQETGLLAPPHDAPGLAAHLTALAREPGLRARLGAAGLQQVQETFSLEKTAGHLASLFPVDPSDPSDPSDSSILALLDSPAPAGPALEGELCFLSTQPQVYVIATRQTSAPKLPFSRPPKLDSPPFPEYLPDATVIEAAWRAHPALAAQAESLRAAAGPVDGEVFFQSARRAVHLATQATGRGWRKIHAVRAGSVLTAWLVHRLTGLPAGAVIEASHHESRAVLAKLLPDFAYGSNSDPKLKTAFPDLLKLAAPAPARRVLGLRIPAPPVVIVNPEEIWKQWL